MGMPCSSPGGFVGPRILWLGSKRRPLCTPYPYVIPTRSRYRIFPLEEHSREIGRISIRAWMATPRTFERDVPDGLSVSKGSSNPGLDRHTTRVDIITTTDPHDESEGNEDEDLFFELSKSSASDSSASTPLSMPESLQSSGETSAVIEPLATGASTHSVERDGQFYVQRQQHASQNQRKEPGVRGDPETPNTSGEVAGTTIAELGHHSAVKTQTRGQQPPVESGAARSRETPSHGVKALHAIKGVSPSDTPSLDVAAAMLPLIPSYPLESAEIRVLIRSLLLPIAGVDPTTPPYVRISLQPGAYSIARSTPATLSHDAVKRSTNQQQGGEFSSKASCSTGSVVEYLVGGEARGLQVGHQVLALSLGPDVARMVKGKMFGPSTPSMRLEIVSGRTLGRCDLALPEALRRPGSSFKNLHVPIWKSQGPQGQSKRRNVCGKPNLGFEKSSKERFSRKQGVINFGEQACGQCATITGKINIDFGVVLTGETEGSPSEKESCAIQQTTGTVRVDTMGIRFRDADGGRVGLHVEHHFTGVVGISATLELGGETRFSTFDQGGEGGKGATAGEGCSVGQELPHCGQILLKSSCTELDVLTLRLSTAREIKSSSGSSFLRHGEVVEKDRGRDTVTIAVSDINDIFEGGAKWVVMSHHCFGDGQTGQKRTQIGLPEACGGQNAGATCRSEVQLRVSLSDTTPVMEHRRNLDTTPGHGVTVKDPESWQKPSALTDAPTHENAQVGSILPKSTTDGEPWRALDAWIASPHNRCAQARVNVSSLGEGRQVPPLGGATNATSRVSRRAGEVLLEVLAIHGQGMEGWPTAVSTRQGHCDNNRQTSSSVGIPPSWWVRITFSDRGGGKGRGEEGRYFVVDSPPGLLPSLEESTSRRCGEEAIAAPPPMQQSEGESCGIGGSWVVRWPRACGVVVRCPVHWNLGQKKLPVVFFEVFRGQV